MARILIVDDEPAFRDILKQKLEQSQHTVFTASNGKEGLEFLKGTDVDLILLDLLMPEMDGMDFCYHLKNTLHKNTPIIVLTNLNETPIPSQVLEFHTKADVSLDDVLEMIGRHVHHDVRYVDASKE